MEKRFDDITSMVGTSISTKKKRHITGGVLLSIALLCAGLAITVLTTKMEDDLT